MKATVSKIDKRITVVANKVPGIDSYDIDNNYPVRVRDIADNSGMGSSCLDIYKSFLYGNGFEEVEFAKAPINRRGLTPDQLLNLNIDDFAYTGGFAIHVNYNALYEKSEINYHPVSTIRFTNKDSKHFGKYAVYKDWGIRNIDEKFISFIDTYDPRPEVVSKQVEAAGGFNYYKGQILYVSNRYLQYPKAIYDAVLEDMQTDSKSKTYKYRNVTNNFLASHMLVTTKTEGNDPEGEQANNGVPRRRARETNALVDTLTDFQGGENAGQIMHVEKETPDQLFELVKIDQQNGDRTFEFTEGSVQDNIRKRFIMPSILLQQQAQGIGETNEFINAHNYYNRITKNPRLMLEEAYRKVFENFKDPINTESNYYIIPLESMKKNDAQKNKDIMEVLKDQTLSPEQKEAILIKLYEVPEEDAKELTKFKLDVPTNNSNADSTV